MHSLYAFAHSSQMLPQLSAQLSKAVFQSLGEETLLFLANIWSHSPQSFESDLNSDDLAFIALKHAAAFLQAQPRDAPSDFQCILPTLVSSFLSADKRVREAAAECVAAIHELCTANAAESIYAYDAVYGSSSGKESRYFILTVSSHVLYLTVSVQYLEWPDVKKYVGVLHDHRDNIVDNDYYITQLHKESLTPKAIENKKEAKFVFGSNCIGYHADLMLDTGDESCVTCCLTLLVVQTFAFKYLCSRYWST